MVACHCSIIYMRRHFQIITFFSCPIITISINHYGVCKIKSRIMNTFSSMNYVIFRTFLFYCITTIMSRNERRTARSGRNIICSITATTTTIITRAATCSISISSISRKSKIPITKFSISCTTIKTTNSSTCLITGRRNNMIFIYNSPIISEP